MTQKLKLKLIDKGKAYLLEDSALYNIRSKKRLAKILNLTIPELNTYTKDQGNYTEFEELGKSGKPRKIQKPCLKLDIVHTRIASLLIRITTPSYLHSGKKKHSNVTNALAHKNSTSLMATDIKSFFPSTTRKMIFSFFYTVMNCSSDVADILSNICTVHNHIPTGSRISMPLSFWANIRMFEELLNLSKKHDITMTVYVDDLTFSGLSVNRLFKSSVRKVISKHGHTMHPTKTKLYKDNQAKLVTGVIVENGKLKVRNEQHKLLSGEIDLWKAIKNIPHAYHTTTTSKLIGRLHSMGVIEPKFKAKARTVKESTLK